MHTRRVGRWSEAAERVLRERYLARSPETNEVIETPEGMCWRVARAVAEAEARYGKSPAEVEAVAEAFYDIMVDGRFLPNSPTLMNAGKQNGLQYSACYVLPVEDSLEGIFEAIKNAAIIHKSGGGTGFALSRLRSKNGIVRTTGGKASGPVSFLRVFNAATEAVKQGGTRRGANMGILRVDHPDILEFIDCKLDGGITNFNISVGATDRFMEALRDDGEYDLVEPHTKTAVGRLRARDVFRRIVDAAWRTGDPGMIFLDRMNYSPANPTPGLSEIEATNPCGEQPLYPNEACNLGSLNVGAFVSRGSDGEPQVDWLSMKAAIRLAVRFLDDVIDVNPYPLPEIDAAVKANRRIGLGIMGWADMLINLGIPYDSERALDLARSTMRFVADAAHRESELLAAERGPFPAWAQSIYRDRRPLRNATVTTIAPTGTISIIAGASSGIEPLYAIAFSHIVGERHLAFVNPRFEEIAKREGFYSEELAAAVAKQGTLEGIPGIPEHARRLFVTAHEIDPSWHVRIQAAFQRHTDNAVSKTINLRHEATVDDVANAYLQAYDEGCLGITVFRDRCKETQVLRVGSMPSEGLGEEPTPSEPKALAARVEHAATVPTVKPRPRVVHGTTYRAETPLGTAFVTVNRNGDGEPLEAFVSVGKAGSDTAAVSEAFGRLISLSLRLPSPLSSTERVREIVDQLANIGGGRSLGFGVHRVRSLPDAIAQVLAEDIGLAPNGSAPPGATTTDLCPECGIATLVHAEGCAKCLSCGFSEC